MTTNATGPARAATPRQKGTPTTSISSETTTGAGQRPTEPPSASPSQAAPASHSSAARRTARGGASDPLSDRSTASLIRRILCPQHLEKARATPAPIEDLLPPLTSRNDVDLQLYALLAIILREYVQNWYNKITPDEAFVAEIIQIIAHCTRALEQRLRKVDLESLLLDEIPDLLNKHISASRAVRDAVTQPPIRTDPREIYHSLCPLPALSPVPRVENPGSVAEQAENEAAYRQLLVQGVLAVLLPTEDLENECLTAIVGQIFSELIIGNIIANRLSEPWLIWEGLCIMSGVIQRRRGERPADRSRSHHKGSAGPEAHAGFSVQRLFLSFLHWCFLAATFVRILVAAVVKSRSLPPRSARARWLNEDVTRQKPSAEKPDSHAQLGATSAPAKTPVVVFRCWSAVSNLLEMDVRMPWLCGTLSMVQWLLMAGPGRIANVDGIVDRSLSHFVHRSILDPAQLPPLLRTVRGSLFPNNMPGKPTLVAPSSTAQLRALKRKCAKSLWALVPKMVGSLYFGGVGGGAPWAPWSTFPVAPGSPEKAGGQQDEPTGSPDQAQVRSGPRNGQSHTLSQAHTDLVNKNDRGRTSKGGRSGSQRQDPSAVSHATNISDGLEESQQSDDIVAVEDRIMAEIEHGILDIFGDAYCNKHLMYSILELVLVRLMPELTEKGVIEMWEERLS